jgi:hypothetical protein
VLKHYFIMTYGGLELKLHELLISTPERGWGGGGDLTVRLYYLRKINSRDPFDRNAVLDMVGKRQMPVLPLPRIELLSSLPQPATLLTETPWFVLIMSVLYVCKKLKLPFRWLF